MLCATAPVYLALFSIFSMNAFDMLVWAALILAAAPFAKPLLSEEAYVRYAAALGIAPSTDERGRVGRLPQLFADMHGWLGDDVRGRLRSLARQSGNRGGR